MEEICTYIHENCGADTPVDIMISANRQSTIITCRSPGKPFYPIKPGLEKLLEASPYNRRILELIRSFC